MDNLSIDKFYADNTGLIHQVARKGYARMSAIGANLDYEDLFQELSITFIKSYEALDVERNGKFSTYFFMAARNRINALAEDFEMERLGLRTVRRKEIGADGQQVMSEDGKVGKWVREFSQVHAGLSSIEEMSDRSREDGCKSAVEIIASDCLTPDQEVELSDTLNSIMGNLSPLARMIMQYTIEPPDFIEREFSAQESHAEFAREKNLPRRCRGSLNVSFVCSVLKKAAGRGPMLNQIKEARLEIAAVVKRSIA